MACSVADSHDLVFADMACRLMLGSSNQPGYIFLLCFQTAVASLTAWAKSSPCEPCPSGGFRFSLRPRRSCFTNRLQLVGDRVTSRV